MISEIFENNGSVRQYSAHQIIIFQSSELIESFYIKSGYVIVYDIAPKGEKKILMILKPGDVFPLIWSMKEHYKARYFYEAYTDCEIAVLRTEKLIEQTKANLEFSNYMLEMSVETIKELMLRLQSLESTSSTHKVGEVFRYLYRVHSEKNGKWRRVTPPVTHQTIAEMSALARETVSLQTKVLIDAGAVKYEKQHYHIQAKVLNANLADEEIS